MLIDWFTIIAQALNFLILAWLLKRFLYRPVLNALDEREKLIASELAQFSSGFKGYERIKEFALVAEEFTTENDLLTPTLKLKRRNVWKKYGDLLNSLWG